MPGDALTDAAARAAEALAELGRQAAIRPACGQVMAPDFDAIFDRFRAVVADSLDAMRDDLAALRRIVEGVGERLSSLDLATAMVRPADPAAGQADVSSCERAGDEGASGDVGAAPDPDAAAADAATESGVQRAQTWDRRQKLIELWALPMSRMSVRQIADALSKLPGPPVDFQRVHRWAYDLGLPYRDPSHPAFGRPRTPKNRMRRIRTEASAQPATGVADPATAPAGAQQIASPGHSVRGERGGQAGPTGTDWPATRRDARPAGPSFTGQSDRPSALGDPRNWPRPPDRITVPGQHGAGGDAGPVKADFDTVRAWAAPRGVVFSGRSDMETVNLSRERHGQPPFQLVDARGMPA